MATLTREIAEQLIGLSIDVIIPSNYTSIEAAAFANTEIRSVVIPGSVTTIGVAAFSQSKLRRVEIEDGGATIIGDYAFTYSDIENVKFGSDTTSIGYASFGYNQLTNVRIPKSVTTIGDYAFTHNPDLKSIKINRFSELDLSELLTTTPWFVSP